MPGANLDRSVTGQKYEIYKQDVNAVDMYTHFRRWKWFFEEKLLSRKLQVTESQNEFIFPTIGSNGVVYPSQELSYDAVQEYIDEFRVKAGLTGQFTTHSLCRGGSQYRFMSAPLGQRWTLSRIRWWGGWAKTENVSALFKLLSIKIQKSDTRAHRLIR